MCSWHRGRGLVCDLRTRVVCRLQSPPDPRDDSFPRRPCVQATLVTDFKSHDGPSVVCLDWRRVRDFEWMHVSRSNRRRSIYTGSLLARAHSCGGPRAWQIARKLTIRAPCYYVSTDRDSDSESPRIQAGDDPLVGSCSLKTRPRQAVASVGLYGPWRAAGDARRGAVLRRRQPSVDPHWQCAATSRSRSLAQSALRQEAGAARAGGRPGWACRARGLGLRPGLAQLASHPALRPPRARIRVRLQPARACTPGTAR